MHKRKTWHFTPASSTAWRALVLESALSEALSPLQGLGCGSAAQDKPSSDLVLHGFWPPGYLLWNFLRPPLVPGVTESQQSPLVGHPSLDQGPRGPQFLLIPTPCALQPSTLHMSSPRCPKDSCRGVSWGSGRTLVPGGHPGKWIEPATWCSVSFTEPRQIGPCENGTDDDFKWLSNITHRTS